MAMPHNHNHGDALPSHCRVGFEGLIIPNNTNQFDIMYTDGLISCVQVIIRTDQHTFMCHMPKNNQTQAVEVLQQFFGLVSVDILGPVQNISCYSQQPNGPLAHNIIVAINAIFNFEIECNQSAGVGINLQDGVIVGVPVFNQATYGGAATHPELFFRQYSDGNTDLVLGLDGTPGDYSELCPVCQMLYD